MNIKKKIVPVILSGGMGTRLWPMSRGNFPKQFLKLFDSEKSLIQKTLMRVNDKDLFTAPIIVSNVDHRFLIAEQMQQLGIENAHIILEPEGKNTAPAIVAASLYVEEHFCKDSVMLVLPSDHIILDHDAFIEGVKRAVEAANTGNLVTFGINPTYPETGYGYILHNGKPIDSIENAYTVESFIEKPELAQAEKYLESGKYFWNSGMFALMAKSLKAEAEIHCPSILKACEKALATKTVETDFVRLGADAFGSCVSDSIDYAIMENSKNVSVVTVDCNWSDAGSWEAMWKISNKDNDNNVNVGDNVALDTTNCFISSTEDAKVVTIGVDNLAIISTKDAILVADKKQSQKVKNAVALLKTDNADLVQNHRRVYRPWGYYESINARQRHQVKRINVKPGAKLSLQMHYHRAEHWVIVRGTAKVTCGDTVSLLSENQSIYIPYGVVHRVENPGKLDLDIIEVQSGSYLGEDDIVRFEDQYGRSDQASSQAAPKTTSEEILELG
ncbi:MAG: mannose-1-phosphate guanylyltransferase/mannose-6-phosphate isomerase [Rickettsiales bacterium]|nr:mannose-1-phosphate guanylyltransferase/mannose-6-phosphate isomerase [Rickettsiales bacterium]